MNNNDSSISSSEGGLLGSHSIGGFGYGVGVSVGILLLITTITLASYFCTRSQQQQLQPPATEEQRQRNVPPPDQQQQQQQHCAVQLGLDEATITSYPTMMYSEIEKGKLNKNIVNNNDYFKDSSTSSSCCSICLADYKETSALRVLPDCGHLFHVNCVDPWLRLNSTCPVCRASPVPTPLPSPLAEVVPFATRHDA